MHCSKSPSQFCLVVKNWSGRLCCCVKCNNAMGQWFPILYGVRQGGVLSPYLYAIYVDELMNCAGLVMMFTLVQCLWGVCFMPTI